MPWSTFYKVVRVLSPSAGWKALGSIIHSGYDYTDGPTHYWSLMFATEQHDGFHSTFSLNY